MLSTSRQFPASGLRWRLLHASIALAIAAGTCPSHVKAQSFVLYDPNISSSPQTVVSATLDELLVPGSYAIADGAEFSNFQFSPFATGGAQTPTAADMLITAPASPSPELNFLGGMFYATGLSGSQFVDANLQFDVTELSPNQMIMTAELKYTGGTEGDGMTSISEDVDDMDNNVLGERAYVLQNGGGVNAGTLSFAGQQEIQVSKDIMLIASGTSDVATLSDFSQTFDASTPAVPEPSSIMMAILGSGGLGLFGWRRRTKRRRTLTRETASVLPYPTALQSSLGVSRVATSIQ